MPELARKGDRGSLCRSQRQDRVDAMAARAVAGSAAGLRNDPVDRVPRQRGHGPHMCARDTDSDSGRIGRLCRRALPRDDSPAQPSATIQAERHQSQPRCLRRLFHVIQLLSHRATFPHVCEWAMGIVWKPNQAYSAQDVASDFDVRHRARWFSCSWRPLFVNSLNEFAIVIRSFKTVDLVTPGG
jgi:hypothetical protein